MSKKRYTYTLSEAAHARLERLAQRRNVSDSRMVELLIEDYQDPAELGELRECVEGLTTQMTEMQAELRRMREARDARCE